MSRGRQPWRARLTLRSRMVLVAAASVAAVVVAGGALTMLAVRAQLIETADDIGAGRAEQIATLAARGALPKRLVLADDLEAAAQVVRDGEVISSTHFAAGRGLFRLPEQPVDSDTVLEVDRLPVDDDGPYRVTARGTRTPLGNATVYVAVDIEDINEAMTAFITGGAVGLALLVVAVSIVCWIVIGRTLAPVDAISQQAELITGQRLDQRVPVPPAKDEVHRLARTINDMLTRLELSARKQERFVADAAHELRTPLASVRVRLETALARGRTDTDRQLVPDLLAETLRLSSVVDQLLLLARSDAGIVTRATPVDLDDVVRDVLSGLPGSSVTVRTGFVEPAQVQGEAGLLEQVTRNLVENGVRHAKSAVEVSLRREGEHAVLTVDDDGPGIPRLARSEVFHRFVRLDEDRGRDGGGVGLGLAIVDAIVRLHSGTVEVSDSPAGGARLTVQIPLA
jgi:signal transduction histidine kinase